MFKKTSANFEMPEPQIYRANSPSPDRRQQLIHQTPLPSPPPKKRCRVDLSIGIEWKNTNLIAEDVAILQDKVDPGARQL